MCRLFGFRSVIPSQVHRSLVSADNALAVQSERHPDGWGVAYYVANYPHVIKSPLTAISDKLFKHVSGVVMAETVVAHVRKATQGEMSMLNCHPFQFGQWVMAHNGDIPNFEKHKDALLKNVDADLRGYILGSTDSEVIFYLFLTHLRRSIDLHENSPALDDVVDALRKTIKVVRQTLIEQKEKELSLLTMTVTNGRLMIGLRAGKELFFSTFKNRCMDRAVCKSLSAECEAPTRTGFVTHFLLCSEPLHGENIWIELDEGEIVAVDHQMKLHYSKI